jgi:predicted Zn-dependent protease
VEDLLNTLEKTVNICEQQGAEAEVLGVRRKEIIVTMERSDIKLCIKQYTTGIGVRTLKGTSVGFASCNTLDDTITRETAEKAVAMSRKTLPVPFATLASPGPLPVVKGLYDPDVVTFDEEDAISTATTMIEAAAEHPHVSIDNGEFAVSVREKAVLTTAGVSASEKMSRISWFLFGMARDNDDVGSYEYQYGCCTHAKDIYVEKTAHMLAEKAAANLNPRKIEPFSGDLILGPEAVSELIGNAIIFSVNANNVYRGQSVLATKRGEQIASPIVTIRDNPLIPADVNSSMFDREGTPHQNVTVLDKGVLHHFLYDSLAANREGQPSTGNATGNFREIPRIGIANYTIEGTSHPLETLLQEVDKGLMITRFSGATDQISGDFSGAVKGAHLIESGEVTHSVKEATIAGNVFEILPKIRGISEETLRLPKMVFPYVTVPDMQVIA